MKTLCSAILTTVVLALPLYAQVTPSGGSTDIPIIQGSTVLIGWARNTEAPSVDIYLWNASTSERTEVARGIPGAQGEFQWSVPIDAANGSRYRFVVEATNERYRRTMSASWVTIGPYDMHKQSTKPEHSTQEYANVLTPMSIAPQPAREVVRIKFGADFHSMRVVGLDGTTLIERTLCNGERTVDVDVQILTSGVYTVVLASNDGRCITTSLHVMQ